MEQKPTDWGAAVTDHAVTDDRVAENAPGERLAWYDITFAGKQFNISSRRGELHIRGVERLIAQTLAEMEDRLEGQGPTNRALLIALNLADQLLDLKNEMEAGRGDARLESMVSRLAEALPNGGPPAQNTEKKDTPAVYDRLEFF